jgi:hypothetical protein
MLPILLIPALVAAPSPKAQDTPPFDLASEYIREICELWEIQGKVDQELVEDQASGNAGTSGLMTSIRNSTRVSLALKTNIATLKKMRLTREPHEKTLGIFVGLYEQKLQLHNDLIDIATTFLSDQKPGVDYGKIAAKMPQITVMLDEVDHTLYKMTPLMFGALIDMKPDSLNRCNHLVITREQRGTLVGRLDGYFGAALGVDKRYIPASARLMKLKLMEFKCSDEPWD